MHSPFVKTSRSQQESAAHLQPEQDQSAPAFQFKDNRQEAVAQRQLQEIMQNGPKGGGTLALQPTAQQQAPIQKKNDTGLPDNLKSGVENLSGLSMDDVKVHYNSSRPAQMQAHAYAQGTDIHVAPGQEKHLPHEAWHVVQQKQGRVRPTAQLQGGVNINDDKSLEREADVMGGKSLQRQPVQQQAKKSSAKAGPIQTKAFGALVAQLEKKPGKFPIITLTLEGVGHIALGILGVLAGAGVISSAVLAPAGIIPIIGGVGQLIVGASKIVRAGIMGYARYKGTPLSEGQKTAIASLTAIEAAISVATAAAGAAAAHGVIAIIAKVVSLVSSFIKYIRGLVSLEPKTRKKVSKFVVVFEGVMSALSAIGDFIAEPGRFVMSAITYLINLVKELRGGQGAVADAKSKREAQAQEARETQEADSEGETEPLLSGAPPRSYGTM